VSEAGIAFLSLIGFLLFVLGYVGSSRRARMEGRMRGSASAPSRSLRHDVSSLLDFL
jgi:hypothetical protein